MASKRILYVCQEVAPCLPENEESTLCRHLPQQMQERGCEIRSFMPRFGCINERRNQLHEVIRLSGMNLIIDNNDHQLIIKVASLPGSRTQIYFIDNDDFFARKAVLKDASGKLFQDNDERMIFFTRGVIETVRKLRWNPSIIHCHGWFSVLLPLYFKTLYADDPIFRDTKIVLSLYDDGFDGQLTPFRSKLEDEEIADSNLSLLDSPTYENLYRSVINHVDGLIEGSMNANKELVSYAESLSKPVLKYQSPDEDGFYDNYNRFYESLL